MDGHPDTVVRNMASGGGFLPTLGARPSTGKAARVARSGVARGMEPDRAERLDNTAREQYADELKRLYATIADLRERLDRLGDRSWLGAADVVLLHALSRPMTRTEIAEATGMSAGYLHVRLHRLRAMGHVEDCGQVSRIGRGKGKGEWIWRKTPNVGAKA